MIRIAVVGDIGSGKSHIAKQFGFPVFNADVEVATLYRKSRKYYNKLKRALPKHVTSFPVKKNDILIFVDAEKKEINKRLRKRFKNNKNIIKKFRKLQLPIEFKKKISDFSIKNNFNNNSTKKNVKKVLKEILFYA